MEAEARTTFQTATATARALRDPSLLGRAALGFAGQWSVLGRVDEARLALLEEALVALGDEDSPLRARLLARLALELYYSGDPERGWRCPSRRSTSRGGSATRARWPPASTPATTRCGGRRTSTSGSRWRPSCGAWPRRPATRSSSSRARAGRWSTCSSSATSQGADIQIAAASKLAEALQRPIWRWWTSLLRCTRAQLAGRFDEAEQLADEALEIGRHGQAENAVNAYWQAMFNIRREQGRLAEVEPSVRRFIDLYPMLTAWRAALALLLIELGRVDEAREEFDGAGGTTTCRATRTG